VSSAGDGVPCFARDGWHRSLKRFKAPLAGTTSAGQRLRHALAE
jgi:hypothetical protein